MDVSNRRVCSGANNLLQSRIFRLCLLENRDFEVGVFPECEEVLIRGFCLGGVALHRVGTTELEVSQGSDRLVHNDLSMVDDFREFGCGFTAPMRGQVRLSTHIRGVERERPRPPKFIGNRSLKTLVNFWRPRRVSTTLRQVFAKFSESFMCWGSSREPASFLSLNDHHWGALSPRAKPPEHCHSGR